MDPRPISPKSPLQHLKDFIFFPIRAIFTHKPFVRSMGLSTLQDERLLAVWPHLRGRVLDIGAGDNRLIRLYKNGVGVDVYPWHDSLTLIQDAGKLPFDNNSFDTITIMAGLNHIPNRDTALKECFRVLKPSGNLVLTMIDPWIGYLSHVPHEESHERGMHCDEVMGLWPSQVKALICNAGFIYSKTEFFFYGLNRVYIAAKPA